MSEVIVFDENHPSLDDLSESFWNEGETKIVEFYPDTLVSVTLISSDSPALKDAFNNILEDSDICVDFEWKPDNKGESNPISLFQFCTSQGVLIVPNAFEMGTDELYDFMQNHSFYAKGISTDKKKLRKMFDDTFDIIDVEKYYLLPYSLPINFDAMIEQLIGKPSAQFKDKIVSVSDWTQRPLTVKQVLYAAFDAFGLYKCLEVLKAKYKQTTIQKKPKTTTTKRTRCRTNKIKKMPTPKSYHPVFNTDVAYRGDELFNGIFRDAPIYKVRNVFGPKETMLEFYLARGEATENSCKMCNMEFNNKNELKEHLWSKHGEVTPVLYFPLQTQSFLTRVIHEIQLGILYSEEFEEGRWRCKNCGKVTTSMHNTFTHARLEHYKMLKTMPAEPLKDIVFNYFKLEKRVNENEKKFDDIQFNSIEEMKDYIWDNHGTVLGSMWKHIPSTYPLEFTTSQEVVDLGTVCANTFIYGTVNSGILSCWDCCIGFDSPSELFVHLFHKHTNLYVLNKKDIPHDFPLMVSKTPGQFNDILRKFCIENATEELVIARIFERKGDFFECHCTECDVDMNDDNDVWEHISNNHLVCVFQRGKAISFSDSDSVEE